MMPTLSDTTGSMAGRADDVLPLAPEDLDATEQPEEELLELALKLGSTATSFTSEFLVHRIALPAHLVATLLEDLRQDKMVEVLGESGPYGYRYALTDNGRKRALHLFDLCGYAGPAPVSLQSYITSLEDQVARLPAPSPSEIDEALAGLVLPRQVREVAGIAASSGRSLFIHGPSGNGKTSLGHLIHGALDGTLWIPHAVAVGRSVIRFFDPQCHQPAPDETPAAQGRVDRRWVHIRRPFVVVAGELRIEDLDLQYSFAYRHYEAPLHVKANGGTFVLDDFGRQRVEPRRLLNRWVFPLENGFDHLTLQSGQKLQVPFRQMLIVCTNLRPDDVMDAAFLRRMGYRLHLANPSPQEYRTIFERYSSQRGLPLRADLLDELIERHRTENRPLRGCEPRDLIDRAIEVCLYRGEPPHLDGPILDAAWRGYFGDGAPGA